MGFVDCHGARLYFDRVGSGDLILTMHGGMGLDHTVFRPWHDELAQDHSIIYYDHRNNGRSQFGEIGGVDCWQGDAAGMLDALGESSAVVLGHSYGAWLALGFAIRYPQRVRGLILSGAFAAFDYAPALVERLRKYDAKLAQRWLLTARRPPGTDTELRRRWLEFLPFYFHGPPRPAAFENVVYSSAAFRDGARCLRRSHSLLGELPALKVPLLLIVGQHDLITPPEQSQRIAAVAPVADVVELAHVGHFPFIEAATVYVGVIRDWLRTIR